MSFVHAYIDESGRQKAKFMMCAATVALGDVAVIRDELLRIRPKGSSRIHMKSAGKEAGRIIRAVSELDVHSYLFVVNKDCAVRDARDLALTQTFEKLRDLGVTRTVIESCSQDSEDRRIIQQVLGSSPAMEYRHEQGNTGTPLLWIPDVHAWAWGRSATFRAIVAPRVTVEYVGK